MLIVTASSDLHILLFKTASYGMRRQSFILMLPVQVL